MSHSLALSDEELPVNEMELKIGSRTWNGNETKSNICWIPVGTFFSTHKFEKNEFQFSAVKKNVCLVLLWILINHWGKLEAKSDVRESFCHQRAMSHHQRATVIFRLFF